MATIKGIKAGQTTINATYGGVTSNEVSFTVNKATGFLTATTTNRTYTGSAQTIATIATNSGDYYFGLGSSTTSGPSSWGSKNAVLQATNAGTYYVWAKCDASTNYNAVSQKYIATVTIAQREVPVTTVPTFVSGTLTYNGSAQTILNAGECGTGGTMYYYISTSSTAPTTFATSGAGWSTSRTATNKGTYYAWYYCYVPDTNNNKSASSGTAINTITAVSSTKQIGIRTVTITAPTKTDRTYTGSAQTIFTAGSATTGGQIYYSESDTDFSTSTWTTTIPYTQKTNAGTYTIYWYCYVSDTTNNTGTGINTKNTLTATIGKKSTAAPVLVAGTKATYDGTAVYATAKNGSGNPAGKIYYGTSAGATTYNITASSTAANLTSMGRTDVGTTTIHAFFRPTDTDNYSDSADATTTATVTNKATPAVPALTSGTKATYDGSPVYAKGANVAGNPSGSIFYGASSGSTTYRLVVAAGATTATNLTSMGRTDVGTTTIYAFFRPDDTNNWNDSAKTETTTATVTNKATPTMSLSSSTGNTTYPTVAKIEGTASVAGTIYWGTTSSSSGMTSTQAVTGSNSPQITSRSTYGTTTVYAYFVPDDTTNWNSLGSSSSAHTSQAVTVSKRTVTITAPTKTNRTYTGSAQTIFTAGSATTGGQIYYSESDTDFSTSTWTTTIPYTQKTNAGTYTIYWYCYVSDTTNNTGTGINTKNTLTATIGKKATTAPTLVAGTKATYDGTAVYATAASASGNPAGKIYYGATSGATTYSLDVAAGSTTAANLASMGQTNVGTTTIYAFFRPTDTNNYSDSSVVNTTAQVVGKATLSVTEVNYNGTYDASSHSSTVKVTSTGWDGKNIVSGTSTSYGTSVTTNGVTGTAYTLKSATNYTASTTIYYKITGGTNYNDYEDSVTFAIAKATPSAPTLVAGTKATYDGTYVYATAASTSKCATPNTLTQPAGKIYYGASSGSTSYSLDVAAGSTTAAELTSMGRKDVGTTTIYAFFRPTDTTNYNDSAKTASTTAKVTNKATLSVTEVNYSGTYDGSEHKSTVKVNNTDWTGQTIVKGSSTSYGTTVTSSGVSGTAYALYTATNYTASTTVYYKITGDNNYNDYEDSVTFAISKVAATLPTTWEGDSKSYDDAQTTPASLTYSGHTGGTIKFRYDTAGGTNYGSATTTPPTRNTVGDTTVQCMVEGDGNHTSTGWSDVVTLSVYASTDARMTITLTARTYNTNSQVIATGSDLHYVASYKIGYIKTTIGGTAPSQPTQDSQLTWSNSYTSTGGTLSATDAGDYYVYYTFTPGTGHSNSKTREYVGKVTISKATGFATATVTNRTYNTSSQTIATKSTNSGDYYFAYNNSSTTPPSSGWGTKNTALSATNAGDYYVWMKCDESANYNAVSATYIGKATISKANGSITYNPSSAVTEYCTSDAKTANTADGNRIVTVATASATSSTNTGVTITYAISVKKGTTTVTGWTIASNGQTITIPSGTTAGEYTVTITATAPTTSNYNAVSTNPSPVVTLNLEEVVLSSVTLTISPTTVAYMGTATATVMAQYSNNTPAVDVTSTATYTIQNPEIAEIS